MKKPPDMKAKIIMILIFIPGILLAKIPAFSSNTVNIGEGDTYISAGKYCEVLEDKSGLLKLDTILTRQYSDSFRSPGMEIPNFGFTSSTFWIRLFLKNETADTTMRLIEVAFPQLDAVEFYLVDGKGELLSSGLSGRDFSFKKGAISHRNHVFQFEIPPGTTRTCYLKIKTEDGMIFPLQIWTTSSFIKKVQAENLFFGIYYGIILVMIFYNLFIFASTEDKNYLYYVLFITFFGLFQMSMNGLSFQYIWTGSPWLGKRLTPFFIGMSCMLAGMFSVRFLEMKRHTPVMYRIMQLFIPAGLVLACSSFITDYRITIIAGQLLPSLMIFIAIAAAITSLMQGNRSARLYLIAWTVFFAGVILSALRVAGILPHNRLTEYGLQVGSEIEIVFLSLALADRINLIEIENNRMQKQLITEQEQKVAELNKSHKAIEEANALLRLSEEKYRLIVEGSSDVIFTLDQDLNFLSANHAIAKELKLDPQKIAGLNFMDILYIDKMEQNMLGLIVKEKLDEFIKDRQPVYFRAQFTSSINMEPKEMQVYLKYINIQGKNEILGKVTNIAEDSLLNCLVFENQKYEIGNYLITAEEIVQRITRNIKKFVDQGEIRMMQIAIREVIINAIEHGNLDISFEEKSAAMTENRYFQLIRERQNNPSFMTKKVLIENSINSNKLMFIITDQGKGFEYAEFMNNVSRNVNNELLPHGRGLSMTKNVFDEVSFDGRGNKVTLIKYIDPQKVS